MKRIGRRVLALMVVLSLCSGLSGRVGELPPIAAASDLDANAAVQQVIQRSNDEQVQAIASRDSSGMADTVTSEHYQELVQINQDLLDHGVASIELVALQWGAVAVNGSTATATTYEMWSTQYADGTSGQSRARNDYALILDSGAWKIKSDSHPDQVSAGGPPGDPNATTPPPQLPFPGIPDNQNTSHNWSGYAATGGEYTAVNATWTVPQFSADGPFGIDAAWVGIGGVRSRDLIQAGTQQIVTGTGSTRYEAWVEMLPRASQPVPLRVHAGDSVSVSIAEQTSKVWQVSFTNNTTSQTYQATEQYASTHSSAEWVEEAPSGGRGRVLPLDNFGSVEFSDGSTVKDGQPATIAETGARAITMLGNANQPLAVPSKLTGDGTSFTVARTNPAGQ